MHDRETERRKPIMLLKTSINGSELENGSEILELIDVTEEDGASYGLNVPESSLAVIESSRIDRDEIEQLAFYDDIKDNPAEWKSEDESIAKIMKIKNMINEDPFIKYELEF